MTIAVRMSAAVGALMVPAQTGGAGSGYTPSAPLDWDFFPWQQSLSNMIGGGRATALQLLLLSLIIAAALWALAHVFDLGRLTDGAKIGVLVCLGAGPELVGFFASLGSDG